MSACAHGRNVIINDIDGILQHCNMQRGPGISALPLVPAVADADTLLIPSGGVLTKSGTCLTEHEGGGKVARKARIS